MIRINQKNVAIIPLADDPNTYNEPFGSSTILGHTLLRLNQSKHLQALVLLHHQSTPLPILPDDPDLQSRLEIISTESPLGDARRPARLIARAWSPTAWRGGIGGATIFDEILFAGQMAETLRQVSATAGLLVSPLWPLVDPSLIDQITARHLEQPEQLRLVFTQAPPGLCPCLIDLSLLEELASKDSMIGSVLDYHPIHPQGDPIGKDTCVQINPKVRNTQLRFTFDALRWRRLMRYIEQHASPENLLYLDASDVVDLAAPAADTVHQPLPQQVTLELTTERNANGPVTPQHYTQFNRQPMSLDVARELFSQFSSESDIALTLGGLGDPLLHPQWSAIVQAAHDAGIAAIHIQTDLIVDRQVLERILDLPVDVLSVNINADTSETYERLMGVNAFKQVLDNIEWLLNHRSKKGTPGLPWIAPRITKTTENVHELEPFFDRWTYFCQQAVIESPTTGAGQMPALAVLNMAPPKRVPCRQLSHRMTIHCDGTPALCDQDWNHNYPIDRADAQQVWASIQKTREIHQRGEFDSISPCSQCSEWHRP